MPATEPDLTGWIAHDGDAATKPPDDMIVRVLLRGKPDQGPRESGPTAAQTLDWLHAPAEPSVNLKPLDMIRGVVAGHGPAGDIIAWRKEEVGLPFTRFPHVRADMGVGR